MKLLNNFDGEACFHYKHSSCIEQYFVLLISFFWTHFDILCRNSHILRRNSRQKFKTSSLKISKGIFKGKLGVHRSQNTSNINIRI